MRTHRRWWFVPVALVLALAGAPAVHGRTLSFDERVSAQRSLEEVFWRHRIWPAVNGSVKPTLDQVLTDSAIRAKVDDYLRMSNALEQFWDKPISASQLQAEMDRMASDTRDPQMLTELFEALGNDPLLIAECLARPALADRLLHQSFSSGEAQIDSMTTSSEARLSPELSFEVWWERARTALPAEVEVPDGQYAPLATLQTLSCPNDGWTPTTTTGAPSARNGQAAVWTGSEMIVWGGCNSFGLPVGSGSRYSPALDSWSSTGVPPAEYFGSCDQTAVWTGSRMIVWGGGYQGDFNAEVYNTGGLYNPASNTWTATSTGAGVPQARRGHSAVWTGSEMIVWGGFYYSPSPVTLKTGGRYNPNSNTWIPTGSGLLCSGGTNNNNPCQSDSDCPGTCSGGATPGESCLPSDASACLGACQGNPTVRCSSNNFCHSLGLGNCVPPAGSCTNFGACMPLAYVPTARTGHTAVWTGRRMIVWGGGVNTGGQYDPATDTWTPTNTGANVPSARSGHSAVWTGRRMIVWGGVSNSTGGLYEPTSDSWVPTGTGANVPSGREYATAVWTGSEMIVWGGGGFVSGVYFNTGGRYDPATSGWTATSTGANVPTARTFHSAVWTGSEMIVWGGNGSAVPFNTGGRYCAASSCSVSTWYRDADADGYGSSSDVVLSCDQPPGYAPAGGDCNESNGNVHPGALELCNLIDDNCDGTIDNAAQPAGSSHVSASHAAGGALISWTSVSGATGYDLVRGSLTVLASSGGNFTLATDACLQDNSPLTIRSDPGAPAPGQGKWYLVRGQNCGGAGTYDSGAPSQVGSRDAEIAAASGACP